MKAIVTFSIPQECGDIQIAVIKEDMAVIREYLPSEGFYNTTEAVYSYTETDEEHTLLAREAEYKVNDETPWFWLKRFSDSNAIGKVVRVDPAARTGYIKVTIRKLMVDERADFISEDRDAFLQECSSYDWDTTDQIWTAKGRDKLPIEAFIKTIVSKKHNVEVLAVEQL